MAGTVSQTQQTAFSTPVDGTAATATVVLSNDNTIRAKHNTHDADATIHLQSSVLASRPAASIAQRVWVTTDGLRAYVDSGTAWAEFAYLPLVGGTVAGTVTATAFVGPITGAVTGNVTGNVTGTAATVTTAAQPAITSVGTLTSLSVTGTVTAGAFSGPLTGNASGSAATVTAAAQPAITSVGTLTSLGVTGTVTAGAFSGPLTGNVTGNASGTAATVTTAAQPAITSVGTLTALTVSGSSTLAAVTGTTATFTGLVNAGAALTSSFGDALRVRADSSASGTVECMRVEMHNSAGVTGTKYAIDAAVYADNATGTLQTIKGVNAAVTQSGAGTTTTAHAFEANLSVTAGTITNATLATLLAPSVSVGTITNLTGLAIGNMSAGGTTNFAITTGTGLVQFGDQLIIAASNGGRAGLRFIAGTTPADTTGGQFWYDGSGYYVMLGGQRYSLNLTLAP